VSSDFSADPYERAFLLSLLTLLAARCVSLLGSTPSLLQYAERLTSIPYAEQFADRLAPVEYVLFVLLVYFGARLLIRCFVRDSEDTRKVHAGMWALLIALSLAHLDDSIRVARAKTAFFTDKCAAARTIPLPEGMADLSLENEPSLFLSLGKYLEALSNSQP
jgi:hypothetical protein